MAQKILFFTFLGGLVAIFEAAAQEPAAPSGLTATPVSKTQIELAWSDNSSNEDNFLLQRRTENGNWSSIEIPANTTSYTDGSLAPATTYYYHVRAEGTCLIILFPRPCESEFSNEARATTLQNPPTINNIPDPVPISEDAALQTIALSGISDGDDISQTISVDASSGNTALIPDPVVTYTSPGSTGTVSYQPAPNAHGAAEITVRVIDSGLENRITETSFTVVVNAINDPPTLSGIASPTAILEDSGEQTLALAGISAGPGESQSLTISAISSRPDIIPDPVVSYNSPGQTASLTYRPVRNAYGTAILTVTVEDSEGGTISRDVEVSVLPVNDAPTADPIAGPGPLSQDAGAQSITLTGISAGANEEQNVTISAVSGNPDLVPDPVIIYTSPNETGVLTFTPVPGNSGTAEITVTIKDDGGTENGGTDTFQQTFTISLLNQPDLVIENAGVALEGQSVAVSGQLVNRGKKDATASTLAYYISPEETLTEEASKLGESATGPLPAGGSADMSQSLQLPATIAPGTYYVFLVADVENSVEEFSEENNMAAVEVMIENMPPRITESGFPDLYTVGSQAASIDITVQDNSGLEATIFHYRRITETNWKKVAVNAESNTYSFSLNDNIFDEIGLAYFFEITDKMGLKTVSDTNHVYISYPGDGLNVPNIKTGTAVNDYQIIAVPLILGNSSVVAAFEDDLGRYDPSQWRLFHYQDSKEIEYGEGLNDLAPGKGYWLITKENNNVDTGIGSTVPVTQADPFTIQLTKGWNQIGNPYNFNLSWKRVLAFNGNPEGIGQLRIYDSGFKDSDRLERFTGAFVFAENDMTLQLPVVKDSPENNGPENGRTITPTTEDGSWELQFTLSGARLQNTLGGLGMKEDARKGKDRYDAVALPYFELIPQLEVIFKNPGSSRFNLSRDIVPFSSEYRWEMEVATNLQGEVTLSWNKIHLPKDLVLFDVTGQEIIDMEHRNSYTFKAEQSKKFQVLYGTPEYVKKSLSFSRVSIGEIYPNPFSDQTHIPISLPNGHGRYTVSVELLEISGKSQGIISSATYGPGRHIITWNGENNKGRPLSPGVYMLKLQVGDHQQFVRRLIIH